MQTAVVEEEDLLAEQVAYYRARAPEYDNWWDRRAQYALDPEHERQWWAERGQLEDWVREWVGAAAGGPSRVLELACGTGNWTRVLAEVATSVTAVDASPEVIGIASGKLPSGAVVRFVEADVFAWQPPPAAFDVVFFSFWLSHVPPSRFEEFWQEKVRPALAPGGRAVLIDNRWRDGVWPRADGLRPTDPVQLRTDLSSGDAYRIVKVYYEPDELSERLAQLGWSATVHATGRFFIAGWATPT